jgi:hypothetical protein
MQIYAFNSYWGKEKSLSVDMRKELAYVIFLPTSHFPCDLTCGTLLSSGRTENKQAGNMALIRFILQVLPSLIRILYTMCVHILAHTWMPIHIHEALCIHL